MLKIKEFEPKDAQKVAEWLKDEKTFWFWSAGRYKKFPLSAGDIVKYNKENKQRERLTAYSAFDGDGLIGYFTVRYPDEADKTTVRLGFIVVNNSLRGRGYGKQMINCAIKFCFEILKAEKITLGVFENNKPALNCYLSCGMNPNGITEKYTCMGEEWNCIDLEVEKRTNL